MLNENNAVTSGFMQVQNQQDLHTCPYCGKCKHCGQPNQPVYPYYVYPNYYSQQQPWGTPIVTATGHNT